MTAEVVILNAEAAVLAADSAVTSDWGDNESKVLYSQNKIFELTHSGNVAIMIYDRNRFISLPLETIIADYRHKNGHIAHAKLADYVEEFTNYLTRVVDTQVNAEDQLHYELRRVQAVFQNIQQTVNLSVRSYMREKDENEEEYSPEEIESLTRERTLEEIERHLESLRNMEMPEGFTQAVIEAEWRDVQPHVEEIREDVFSQELTDDAKQKLDEIALLSTGVILGDWVDGDLLSQSGIVFVGFGDQDLLPSYIEISIEGIYDRHLRIRRGREGQVGGRTDSIVQPFAQSNMIDMFLQGALEAYDMLLDDVLRSRLNQLQEIKDDEVSTKLVEQVLSDLQDARRGYAFSIIRAVASLSKTEMAEMAEALINLMSLDRKVDIGSDESVGGPTDVAVITKADGLVWIKRKQYFEPSLNPEYLARLN